jgi:hypothetical protein
MAVFASWVHGHAGRIEAPDRLVNIVPIGWGLQVAGLPGTDNWLHYAVPTPVIVNNVRAKIVQVGIKATRQSTDARIWAVHAYDGHHRFYANESVPDLAIVTNPPVAGYPGTFLALPVPAGLIPDVRWGIGISLGLRFTGGASSLQLDIAAVGCDFQV